MHHGTFLCQVLLNGDRVHCCSPITFLVDSSTTRRSGAASWATFLLISAEVVSINNDKIYIFICLTICSSEKTGSVFTLICKFV